MLNQIKYLFLKLLFVYLILFSFNSFKPAVSAPTHQTKLYSCYHNSSTLSIYPIVLFSTIKIIQIAPDSRQHCAFRQYMAYYCNFLRSKTAQKRLGWFLMRLWEQAEWDCFTCGVCIAIMSPCRVNVWVYACACACMCKCDFSAKFDLGN